MITIISIYLTGLIMFLLMLIKEANESEVQISARAVGFLVYASVMWFIVFPMYLVTARE